MELILPRTLNRFDKLQIVSPGPAVTRGPLLASRLKLLVAQREQLRIRPLSS